MVNGRQMFPSRHPKEHFWGSMMPGKGRRPWSEAQKRKRLLESGAQFHAGVAVGYPRNAVGGLLTAVS